MLPLRQFTKKMAQINWDELHELLDDENVVVAAVENFLIVAAAIIDEEFRGKLTDMCMKL